MSMCILLSGDVYWALSSDCVYYCDPPKGLVQVPIHTFKLIIQHAVINNMMQHNYVQYLYTLLAQIELILVCH